MHSPPVADMIFSQSHFSLFHLRLVWKRTDVHVLAACLMSHVGARPAARLLSGVVMMKSTCCSQQDAVIPAVITHQPDGGVASSQLRPQLQNRLKTPSSESGGVPRSRSV